MAALAVGFTYYCQGYTLEELQLPGLAIDKGEDVETFIERNFDLWLERNPLDKRQVKGEVAGGEFAIDVDAGQSIERVRSIQAMLATKPRGAWTLLVGHWHLLGTPVRGWTALVSNGQGETVTVLLARPERRPTFDDVRYFVVRHELHQLYFAEHCRRQTLMNRIALADRGWKPGMLVRDVRFRGEHYELLHIISIDPNTTLIEGVLGRKGLDARSIGAFPLAFEPA